MIFTADIFSTEFSQENPFPTTTADMLETAALQELVFEPLLGQSDVFPTTTADMLEIAAQHPLSFAPNDIATQRLYDAAYKMSANSEANPEPLHKMIARIGRSALRRRDYSLDDTFGTPFNADEMKQAALLLLGDDSIVHPTDKFEFPAINTSPAVTEDFPPKQSIENDIASPVIRKVSIRQKVSKIKSQIINKTGNVLRSKTSRILALGAIAVSSFSLTILMPDHVDNRQLRTPTPVVTILNPGTEVSSNVVGPANNSILQPSLPHAAEPANTKAAADAKPQAETPMVLEAGDTVWLKIWDRFQELGINNEVDLINKTAEVVNKMRAINSPLDIDNLRPGIQGLRIPEDLIKSLASE